MAIKLFSRKRKFIRCPSCGSKIFADRKFCPGCGLKLQHKNKKWKKRSIVIASVLGVLLLAGLIFGARYLIIKRSEISFEVHKTVNKRLSAVTNKDSFLKSSYTKRKELIEARLSKLKDEGCIDDYKFAKNELIYEFVYSDGSLGAVMISDFDSDLSGIEKTYAEEDDDGSLIINNRLDIGSLSYQYENADISCSVLGFYNNARLSDWVKKRTDIWNKNGLKTALSQTAAASDLKKHLEGKDLIVLDAHGIVYAGKPALCFGETVTEKNLRTYSRDLKAGNMAELIGAGKRYYLVLPSYFTAHFSDDTLKGSIVYISSCKSADSVHLTKSLTDAGAASVIAVEEDIYSLYNAQLEDAFVYSLLCGDTVLEALDYAKSVYGDNDLVWSREFEDTPTAGKKTEPASPAVVSGGDSTLVSILKE
ncbi:MAG: zinc ribbon domain-containing protein [Ruminococcus sp.]|nr:zinc ribbon domain-containing protein [Ruminococcus sp.]